MKKAILGILVLVVLSLFVVGCQPAGEATTRGLQTQLFQQSRTIAAQNAQIADLNSKLNMQNAALDQTSALVPKSDGAQNIGVRDVIGMFSEILGEILGSLNMADIPEPKEPPTTTYIVNCYGPPHEDKCFVSTVTTY